MSHGPLGVAFVFLAAAVVGVPIAKRLGLGSVLGYLIAGVVIGPHVLHLVGHEGSEIMHFAEFGVVMMLFLVGLELRPAVLWQLRRPILGLGGLQVVTTALVVTAIGIALGMAWKTAVATTCKPPRPRIGRRICQSNAGRNSSPITKSIMTTPNSAKCITSPPPSTKRSA